MLLGSTVALERRTPLKVGFTGEITVLGCITHERWTLPGRRPHLNDIPGTRKVVANGYARVGASLLVFCRFFGS